MRSLSLLFLLYSYQLSQAFTTVSQSNIKIQNRLVEYTKLNRLHGQNDNEGIVELIEEKKEDTAPQAPFLSQGPVENSMSDLLSTNAEDPKETRVILYIIISIIPVLFLIPLMLASRDLIPPESLPPVSL